jgi:hypothetical protein
MDGMEQKPLRDPLHILRCLGELAVWTLQDALIAVDDNIQELPE